jgi:spermidine synthase
MRHRMPLNDVDADADVDVDVDVEVDVDADADADVQVIIDEHVKPYVREELDARSLHFSISEIQSRMQILRPDVLELEYTRTMMGFLMFRPEPKRLAMIGLGGGSIAKFCHRQLPRASLVVVEINPHVIALRDAFEIPHDDSRFSVVAADGARFVAETDLRFDVLMIDAFDAQGMPPAIGTQRFYDDCRDVLTPGGILAVNLHAGHPIFPVYLDRIRQTFGEFVLRVDDSDGSNSVIFASATALRRTKENASVRPKSPARKPHSLSDEAWEQLRGAFSRIMSAVTAPL